MNSTKFSKILGIAGVLFFFLVFSCTSPEKEQKLSVDYEQYQLDNGLDVILSVDKSDPIVALAIQYHVGSNREVLGRTGFAHLFEHMMFQQSENVGQDQFFKMIQSAGGTLNGGTSNDGTIYFEVVPENALERALWLESDRMGYMINTVTPSAFANQQNVVQNEKRQSVDNQPYGHSRGLIGKTLYPEGHPYNWTVIGEMADLFNATVDDVKEFHGKFYVPNNATISLVGDFDPANAKDLIQKYFGEIPMGGEVLDPVPMPVSLDATKKLYHEDNFARTARLNMIWPTVESYHPDAYALDFLSEILSSGKKAPMYKVLEKEKKLTSNAYAYNSALELAGTFNIVVTANSGISLADVEDGVFESFARFEEEGFTEMDLERIKAGLETGFYNGISSVLGKSFQLARYNEYAGNPSFITEDIENIKAVTKEDVLRVYDKYIKNQPYVATSFVPKGEVNLVAEGSENAGIVEEDILKATEIDQSQLAEEEEIVKTETILDRSIVPPLGPDPELSIPSLWKDKTANGMKVYGINYTELPLVQYNIVMTGGRLFDDIQKPGVANLVGQLMNEGTANKTPLELEEEIELLGARINISSGNSSTSISVNALARNYEKTLALVQEMLLEPRWDEEEFELAKTSVINRIKRSKASPNYLASSTFNELVYGKDHIYAYDASGTIESVESITMDDLKAYYKAYLSPSIARFHIVGDISQDQVMSSLSALNEAWEPKEVKLPEFPSPKGPESSEIYFVDVPGAKQSVIQIGYLALARSDGDYFPATVMNYKLGGSFNSVVNMILREEKGFTYGARTSFSGSLLPGPFRASSSVRSNATYESVQIFKESMENYRNGISEEDLEFTKDALIKSNALRFETMYALLSMLNTISTYGLPDDYIKGEEEFIMNLSYDQHKELAQKYILPEKMYYVVAGDAATQLEPLMELGLGSASLIKK